MSIKFKIFIYTELLVGIMAVAYSLFGLIERDGVLASIFGYSFFRILFGIMGVSLIAIFFWFLSIEKRKSRDL